MTPLALPGLYFSSCFQGVETLLQLLVAWQMKSQVPHTHAHGDAEMPRVIRHSAHPLLCEKEHTLHHLRISSFMSSRPGTSIFWEWPRIELHHTFYLRPLYSILVKIQIHDQDIQIKLFQSVFFRLPFEEICRRPLFVKPQSLYISMEYFPGKTLLSKKHPEFIRV